MLSNITCRSVLEGQHNSITTKINSLFYCTKHNTSTFVQFKTWESKHKQTIAVFGFLCLNKNIQFVKHSHLGKKIENITHSPILNCNLRPYLCLVCLHFSVGQEFFNNPLLFSLLITISCLYLKPAHVEPMKFFYNFPLLIQSINIFNFH